MAISSIENIRRLIYLIDRRNELMSSDDPFVIIAPNLDLVNYLILAYGDEWMPTRYFVFFLKRWFFEVELGAVKKSMTSGNVADHQFQTIARDGHFNTIIYVGKSFPDGYVDYYDPELITKFEAYARSKQI
jgi:hypothetical protein